MGQDEGIRRPRIAYVDAARLAAANRERRDGVERRRVALSKRVADERAVQDRCRRGVYDEALVPFRDSFARLKNVDLAPLASIELSQDGMVLPEVACDSVPVPTLGLLGSLATGLGAGAGASSATVAGVGAFAAASTGTPIASLSGVAATNATLAWLGGGTLAAGGGGMAAGTVVLGGVVAAPVVVATAGFVSWKGRRERRAQVATADRLTVAEVELIAEERRTALLMQHCSEVRAALTALGDRIVDRLPALSLAVETGEDHRTWSAYQRVVLAGLVGFVTTAVALMAAPPADDAGCPHPDSSRVLADARRLLGAVGGNPT